MNERVSFQGQPIIIITATRLHIIIYTHINRTRGYCIIQIYTYKYIIWECARWLNVKILRIRLVRRYYFFFHTITSSTSTTNNIRRTTVILLLLLRFVFAGHRFLQQLVVDSPLGFFPLYYSFRSYNNIISVSVSTSAVSSSFDRHFTRPCHGRQTPLQYDAYTIISYATVCRADRNANLRVPISMNGRKILFQFVRHCRLSVCLIFKDTRIICSSHSLAHAFLRI